MADMKNLTGRWNFRSDAPDYVGSFMGGQACFRKNFLICRQISRPRRPYVMA
jgi:hypothetical protein